MIDLGIDGLGEAVELGSGGSGRVFRAQETDLKRWVAVKMIHAANDPRSEHDFQRERQLMAGMPAHIGVAPIYSSGISKRGETYFVMPFYAQGSLGDRLRAGPMQWWDAASIAVQVADAVEHAHRNAVLHCDLKPDNIMIDDEGRPVVVDFGIAQLLEGTVGLSQGIKLTPAYAPPEAFDGLVQDPRSDVYSIGATLFALLTGAPPFHTERGILAIGMKVATEPVPDLRHLAPDAICRCIEKAMAKNSNERYQSAAALGHDLREAAAWASGADAYAGRGAGGGVGAARTVPDAQTPSPPLASGPVASSPSRSSSAAWPIAIGLGVFAVVLIAGLAVWAITRGSEEGSGDARDVPVDTDGDVAEESQTTVQDSTSTGQDTEATVEDLTVTQPSAATDGPRFGEIATTTLEPGDCFNAQLNTIALTVELVDCSQGHTAEVTGVFQSPDAGGVYPGQDQLVTDALPTCEGAFASYVGVNPFLTQLTYGGYLPLFEQWTDEGIYQYSCYATRLDGEPLVSSVQRSAGDADVARGFGNFAVLYGVRQGECFRAADSSTRLALGSSAGLTQSVILEDCANQHGGQVLSIAELTIPVDGLYNVDALEQEAAAVCQGQFPTADPQGLIGIVPDAFDWQLGRIGTFCVFLWAQSTTNFFDVS